VINAGEGWSEGTDQCSAKDVDNDMAAVLKRSRGFVKMNGQQTLKPHINILGKKLGLNDGGTITHTRFDRLVSVLG